MRNFSTFGQPALSYVLSARDQGDKWQPSAEDFCGCRGELVCCVCVRSVMINIVSHSSQPASPLLLSMTLNVIVPLLTPHFCFCFSSPQLNMITKKRPDKLLLNTQPAINLQDYIRGLRRRGIIAKCWGLENLWWLPFDDTLVLISTSSVSDNLETFISSMNDQCRVSSTFTSNIKVDPQPNPFQPGVWTVIG